MLAFLLSLISLWGGVDSRYPNQNTNTSSFMIGKVLVTKFDFDVYRVRAGSRKKPAYYYKILPSPNVGIGGPELDYLGQIPVGTKLKIVGIRKGKAFNRSTYQAIPLSPINQNLKGNSFRESVEIEANLDDQAFNLGAAGGSKGIYAKGKNPDKSPKLNDMWFEVIDPEE